MTRLMKELLTYAVIGLATIGAGVVAIWRLIKW